MAVEVRAVLLIPTFRFLRDSFKHLELLTFSGPLRVGKHSPAFAGVIRERDHLQAYSAGGRWGSRIQKAGQFNSGKEKWGTPHIPPPDKSKADVA